MFKIIVATSASFTDYELFRSKLDHLLQNKDDVEICSGFSLAGDALTDTYFGERDVTVNKFDPGFRGMYRALVYAEAALFFHAGESPGITKYIEEARQCRLKVKIVTFTNNTNNTEVAVKSPKTHIEAPKTANPTATLQQPYNDLDAAIPAGKPRPRKAKPILVDGQELIPDSKPKKRGPARTGQTVYKYDYKQIYLDAHKAWFEKEYPAAFRNGHYDKPGKIPQVDTANGMATFVLNHLNWTGNYGNRINVMGRQIGGITRTQSGAVFDDRKYIKSSTKKGTSDLQIVIRGISAAVEIKIGGDSQSPDQIRQEARIKKAGGQYMIWKSVDHYLDYYYSIAVQTGLFET